MDQVVALEARLRDQPRVSPSISQVEYEQIVRATRDEERRLFESSLAEDRRMIACEAQQQMQQQQLATTQALAESQQREEQLRSLIVAERALRSNRSSAVSSHRSRMLQEENERLRRELHLARSNAVADVQPCRPPIHITPAAHSRGA